MRPLRPSLARRLALGGSFLGGLLLGSACGGEGPAPPAPDPIRVIVTDVPPSVRAPSPEPLARYPLGTRLWLLDRARPAARTPVAGELAAAGGAGPTIDGREVLFAGRADPEASYAVWACRPDGSDLRPVVRHAGDCGRAAELPDGRIVYAGTVAGAAAPPGMGAAWALFVAARDGGAPRRITFGAGGDVDPAVLPDGRIVYAAWEPADGGTYLWTVHPDGTGAARLPGGHGGRRGARWPVPTAHGTLRYALGPEPGAPVFAVDLRAPAAEGASRLVARPGHALTADLVPRTPPQGHLSTVRPGLGYGTLLALDARPHADAGAGRRVRLRTWPGAAARAGSAPGTSLGDLPLAADGSFFVRVPADTPLVLEVVDGEGSVVGRQLTPFWVRPGEVRACVGCHEDPSTAPPNRRPLAVLQDPVRLLGEAGR